MNNSCRWFLAIYVRDVWSRLPELLAAATSVCGVVLKVDSTKKVCKKLQGAGANTAAWATNVGNERGEVLASVLTESEGVSALQRLADGLMGRFERAGQPPPQLLYTDRDCCSKDGQSRFKVNSITLNAETCLYFMIDTPIISLQVLFSRWDELEVRLDIWHFMRRLARGCTSESHPLYGTFMARLSHCIYEWDEEDYDLLMRAKGGELTQAGVRNPSSTAIRKAITREELARHCRRRTRGHESTLELIEALLLALSPATDTLGVPLFREEMKEIWEEQKHHVLCIQDPPNIQLYTITGHAEKGGVRLPVLRCARGSTSLESFHLHLARSVLCTLVKSCQTHIKLAVALVCTGLSLGHRLASCTTKPTSLMASRGGTQPGHLQLFNPPAGPCEPST